jgi:hypothetical protein
LGDERLDNRAMWIGKALSENFGSAMSEIFKSANELKRTYEFLPTAKQTLTK